MVSKKHNSHNHGHDEKTEPGFFGSLIMTAEHILGKTAGTLPVVGLFISSLGAFASAIWYRKHLSNFDMGVRIVLGLAFSALATAVIAFPFIGVFVGISAAGYSVLSNGYEWGKHRIQKIENSEQQQVLKQKAANVLMSLCVLGFIITAAVLPPTATPLLATFITFSVIYLAYSFHDKVASFFTNNAKKVAPSEQTEGDAITPGWFKLASDSMSGVGVTIETEEENTAGNAANELFQQDISRVDLEQADSCWAHNLDMIPVNSSAVNNDGQSTLYALGDLPGTTMAEADDLDEDEDEGEGEGHVEEEPRGIGAP